MRSFTGRGYRLGSLETDEKRADPPGGKRAGPPSEERVDQTSRKRMRPLKPEEYRQHPFNTREDHATSWGRTKRLIEQFGCPAEVAAHRAFLEKTDRVPNVDIYAKMLDAAVAVARRAGAYISDKTSPITVRGIEYTTRSGARAAQRFIFPDAPDVNHMWVYMLRKAPYAPVLAGIGNGTAMSCCTKEGRAVSQAVNLIVRDAVARGLVVAPDYSDRYSADYTVIPSDGQFSGLIVI
jgi:hypothetical protein